MKSNISKNLLKVAVISSITLSTTTFISCTNISSTPVSVNSNTLETIIDIGKGKKGASLSFSVSPKSFSVKANGLAPKKITDISKYQVYLVKSASNSGYPSSGDPLDTPFAGPFDITRVGSSQTITFINITPSGTDTYYVALRAKDSLGNDLIKKNTNWGTLTQSSADGRVFVSSSGISVDSDYKVSDYTNLSLSPNLEDGYGAVIDASINNKTGSLIGDMSISENLYDYGISTILGTGISGIPTLGNITTTTQIDTPQAIVTDSFGSVYFSEKLKILKIDRFTNDLVFIAGKDSLCPSPTDSCGDGGSRADARFIEVYGLDVDLDGNVYIADAGMNKIRKINVVTDIINTISGTGTSGYSGNEGLSTSANLNSPKGVTVTESGDIYIADTGNHCIRKISVLDSKIYTIAGTPTTSGYSGDGGLATDSKLNNPSDISSDKEGNIYFSDTGNHCIRKISVSDSKIYTVAGTPTTSGYSGDGGLAMNSKLDSPKGICVDGASNIYFSDNGNNRVRRISSLDNKISTIAGNGSLCSTPTGSCGDGSLSTNANLSSAYDVYVDSYSGKVYVSDTNDHKIRSLF